MSQQVSEQKYGENELQLALLQCRCNRASFENNDKLYACKYDKCAQYIYCKKCGPFYHDEGHKFDITDNGNAICINDLNADHNEAKEGHLKLKTFLGVERYNRIAKSGAVGSVVLHNATTVSFLGIELVKFFSSVAQRSLMTSSVVGANLIGVALGTTIEIIIHSRARYRGEITTKEWGRRVGKAVIRNGTIASAAYGGAKAGAIIGTAIGSVVPGVGNAVGFMTGLLLGIIIGIAAGIGIEQLMDKLCPPDPTEKEEQERRLRDVHDALIAFNFSKKDIENKKIFNQKELDRRYKRRALEVHPDKRAGDVTQWHVLSHQYGILKGLLEEKGGKKIVVENVEKNINKSNYLING